MNIVPRCAASITAGSRALTTTPQTTSTPPPLTMTTVSHAQMRRPLLSNARRFRDERVIRRDSTIVLSAARALHSFRTDTRQLYARCTSGTRGSTSRATSGDDDVGVENAAAAAAAAAKRERVVAAKWAGSAPESAPQSDRGVGNASKSSSSSQSSADANNQVAFVGESCPLGAGIWDKLREEAKTDLEREPALASYLYSTILAHKKVEDVLAFVLANKLASTVLLDSQLLELFSAQYRKHKHLTRMMLADMQAVFERDPACDRYLAIVLFFKGFQAIQAQRVAHSLWLDDRKPLAFLLQNRISEVFHVDIHPGAVLGQGMMMDHATGVVIGETAVVGENVSILHGVTLGGTGTSKGDRHPKIGDGVVIGAGVTILGNIKVGKNSKIGAGSVVLEEIGESCTAVGIPAKVLSRSPSETQPSLSMDQTSYMSDYFI